MDNDEYSVAFAARTWRRCFRIEAKRLAIGYLFLSGGSLA